VRTDHDCLRRILNIEGSGNPRLARWRLRLCELEFDVAYKPGMTHYLADRTSRLESGASDETAFDDAVSVFATRANTVRGLDAANYVGSPTVRGTNRDTVLSAHAEDGYCQEVEKALNAGRHIPFFEDLDGILRRRAAPDGAHQVVVPASSQEQVLHLEHDATLAGHSGESRMYAAMRRYYYWVGMAADVVSYVRKCDSCARHRVRPLARCSPLTLFPATMPFQEVAVDLYGPLARTAAGHRVAVFSLKSGQEINTPWKPKEGGPEGTGKSKVQFTPVPRRGTKVLRHRPEGERDPKHGWFSFRTRGGGRDLLLRAPTAVPLRGHSGPTHASTPAPSGQARRLRWVAPIRFQLAEICGSKRPAGARGSASNRSRPMQVTLSAKTKSLQTMRNTSKKTSRPTTATSSGQDIQAHVAQSDGDITAPIRPRGEANVGPTKAVQPSSRPIRQPRTPPPRPARHQRDPSATHRFILVITDRFTKLVRAIPMDGTTTVDGASVVLDYWVAAYGPPDRLLSDGGPLFTSHFLGQGCNLLSIEPKVTSPSHPQTNGQMERSNRTMHTILNHYVAEHPRSWDQFLEALTLAYNSRPNRSTGDAPLKLVHLMGVSSWAFKDVSRTGAYPLTAQRGTAAEKRAQAALLTRLVQLVPQMRATLKVTQGHYKRDHDRRLALCTETLTVGGCA